MKSYQSLAFCPTRTATVVAACTVLLLPLTTSEILGKSMINVKGTAMPSWCSLTNISVPDFATSRSAALLACGGECSRLQTCEFFCIIESTCATFKSQVAPYFQGWTGEPHIVYDVCYTSWPGDPLNIITPNLTITGSPYQSGSHPKFVNDGFICGKKVAPGFKSELSSPPFITMDLGSERQVSVVKYLVLQSSTAANLRISLGKSPDYAQNKLIASKDEEPTLDEELFDFSPPETGRFLSIFRVVPNQGKLFLGDITAYT